MQQEQKSVPQLHWAWMVLVLLWVSALAIPQLQRGALWFDEAYTHLYSGSGRLDSIGGFEASLIDTIISIARNNPSWPPLYFVLQNIWSDFTGNTLTSEHMLPLLAGVLGVAVIYRLGKAIFGETGGLIAAILLATSAFYVHFMHETRAYTLYTLFVLLMAWAYWLLIQRQTIESRWLRWGFSLVIAAALYTHYVASAFVLGIAVYHLLVYRNRMEYHPHLTKKRWADIARLWFNGCLLFTPWIAVLFSHLLVESGNDRAVSFLTIMQGAGYGFSNNLWIVAVPLMLGSLLLLKQQRIRFLWVWMLIAIVVIALVNAFASFLFHPRHILALLVVFILLMVASLDLLQKRLPLVVPIFLLVWVGLGSFYSTSQAFVSQIPNHVNPVANATIDQMQSVANRCINEEDGVIFGLDPPEVPMGGVIIMYYFFDTVEAYAELPSMVYDYTREPDLTYSIDHPDDVYQRRITNAVNDASTIWLLTDPQYDLTPETERFSQLVTDIGYVACPYVAEDANIWFYTQEASCQVVTERCS